MKYRIYQDYYGYYVKVKMYFIWKTLRRRTGGFHSLMSYFSTEHEAEDYAKSEIKSIIKRRKKPVLIKSGTHD